MNDINTTTQIVRLTADPLIRYTTAGKAIASFSGASSKSYTKDGEKHKTVSYFDFICWGKGGEVLAEYGKKGMRIAVDGSLQQSRWDDQDGKKRSKVEIVVDNFQFLDSKKSDPSMSEKPTSSDLGTTTHLKDEDNPFSDDDIPF